jgi:hypothetical protein
VSTTELTGGELRRTVYRLVARELGAAALVRFLQENYPGIGDYTEARKLLEQPTVEEIAREIKKSD